MAQTRAERMLELDGQLMPKLGTGSIDRLALVEILLNMQEEINQLRKEVRTPKLRDMTF